MVRLWVVVVVMVVLLGRMMPMMMVVVVIKGAPVQPSRVLIEAQMTQSVTVGRGFRHISTAKRGGARSCHRQRFLIVIPMVSLLE